jgi:hypothetical protein
MSEYALPHFLEGQITENVYRRWLDRRAVALLRRDSKRGLASGTKSKYKKKIHAAVIQSHGYDNYTGETLDWTLIGSFRDSDVAVGKHKYKSKFDLLPSVEHAAPSNPATDFVICAWRTNEAKSALSRESFIELCTKVLINANHMVIQNPKVTDVTAHSG